MRTPKPWIGYAVAVAATAVAALIRAAYDWWFGPEPVYLVPFLAPVAVAGWFGGLRCGLFAVALNAGVAVFFFTEPVSSFGIARPGDAVRVGVFVAVGVGITLLNQQLHHYRRQAEGHTRESLARQTALEQEVAARQEANATLERWVAERTAMVEEGERRFRAIFHTQFQFIGLLSPEGVLMEANRTALAAAGVSEGAVLGRPFWETPWWTHDPAQQDRLREAVRRAAAGQVDRFEASHTRADGTLMWVDFSLTPYREDGRVVLLIPEGRDITEQKRAVETVRASEERFREFMAHAPMAAWVTDCDERLQYVSPGFESLLSLSPDRAIGKTSHDLFPPEIAARHAANNRQVLATGRVIEEEEAFLYADGSTGVAHVVKFPMRGAAGEPQVGGVALDVTAQRRAEAALRLSEERFRTLAGDAPVGIFETDADGGCLFVNARWCILAGLTPDAAMGRGWVAALHPDDRDRVFREWTSATEARCEFFSEYRFRSPAGHTTWLSGNAVALRNTAGGTIGFIGTVTDITERKRAEAALRLSEERFRRLVDGVADHAILMLDPDGHIVSWNPAAVRLKGYTADEILGRHFSIFYRPQEIAAGHPQHELAAAVAEGRYQEEGLRVRKDGSVFWADITISTLRDDDGRHVGFVKFTHDITARKRAEDALRLSEQRFRAIFDQTVQLIGLLSPDGTLLEANRTALEMGGVAAADAIGRPFWEAPWIAGDPDRQARMQEAVARAAAGETVQFEVQFRSANGADPWADFSLKPCFDGEGRVVLLIPEGRDITARKRAEEQVRTSLKEKEVLLKEIHHRVKNNLQIVSALLELQAGHTDDPTVVGMFSESQGRVLSMARIHERLYKSADLARVDFTEYVTQLAADLYRAYRASDDDIRLDLDIAIPPLAIDIAIPCGLLLNELMSNCLKHAFRDSDGGCIRVEFHRQADGTNVLAVSDDGSGLPDGFDLHATPSFGMQLVTTLVDQLDGEITVAAPPGTTFTITFPRK